MAAFGRSYLSKWFLDPNFAYLNHGTVGATPRRVLAAQRELVERIERQPAQFILRELANSHGVDWPGEPPLMRQAAGAVADYVGADVDGLALVDNITTAANAVLRSFPFEPGDLVAVTNLGYGGVTNTVRYVAEQAGAVVYTIELPAPGATASEFAAAFEIQLRAGTRFALVDHITAFSAVVLPVDEFVASCRNNGTLIFLDGAHAPGQLDLDIAAIGPDWYGANLHKWAWAPRSSGFLWTAPQHRDWLHSPVTSWGIGHGLAAEFDSPGTRDPSTFLTIPAALEYRAVYGEEAIRNYNHDLVWTAARYLTDQWGTSFSTPEHMIGSMATIALPGALGSTAACAEHARAFLYNENQIEVPIFVASNERGADGTTGPYGLLSDTDPGLVVRVSTQIYNETADIERLADTVSAMAASMT